MPTYVVIDSTSRVKASFAANSEEEARRRAEVMLLETDLTYPFPLSGSQELHLWVVDQDGGRTHVTRLWR